MKQIYIVALVLLVSPVYAQLGSQSFGSNDVNDVTVDVTEKYFENPGMLPDNPFYGLKRFGEGLRLAFAFDEQTRSRLHMEFARTRLAELKKMVDENKIDRIQQQVTEFENEVSVAANNSDVNETLQRSRIMLAMIAAQHPAAGPPIEMAVQRTGGIHMKEKMQQHMSEIEDVPEQLERTSSELENLKITLNSTNTTAGRLLENAVEKLANARTALDQNKPGEAFGQASAAEHLVENAKRLIERENDEDTKDEEDGEDDTASCSRIAGSNPPTGGNQFINCMDEGD